MNTEHLNQTPPKTDSVLYTDKIVAFRQAEDTTPVQIR